MPHKHKWQLKWNGIVRKCQDCKVTHYWHHCENQWETIPNPAYAETGITFYDKVEWRFSYYEDQGGTSSAVIAKE